MDKNLPIVAIVGPPNAGKSTLLNKIAGKPLAVTSTLAGTTRDRQYAETSFQGVNFMLVDTAGLNLKANDELEKNVQKQIDVALEEAGMIILVVDGKEPVAAIDQKVLLKFRKIKKPKILAVNKLDSPKKRETDILKFARLGIKPMFPVSSITGAGIGDLLDAVADVIRQNIEADSIRPQQNDSAISVGIIGKPNVGKSSIFNKILNQERAVVSSLPGTTRTAVDSQVQINGQTYSFIDTAGLKKKEFRQEQPDVFSGFQSFKAIRRSDVCFFVLDIDAEITKQDQRVAQEIFAMQKGCIILANKIDLLSSAKEVSPPKSDKKGRTNKNASIDAYSQLRGKISLHFPFLWMCPVFFVSAKTQEGLEEAVNTIKPIFDRRNKTIDIEILSEFLTRCLKKNPPKLLRDQKQPKVFSLRQIDVNPPTFELLVNHPAAISQQFRKFLENSIIRDMDFYGTPIVLRLKGKDKS